MNRTNGCKKKDCLPNCDRRAWTLEDWNKESDSCTYYQPPCKQDGCEEPRTAAGRLCDKHLDELLYGPDSAYAQRRAARGD